MQERLGLSAEVSRSSRPRRQSLAESRLFPPVGPIGREFAPG